MCDVLISLLTGLTSTLRTRASLQVEILALRHQLGILQRGNRRRLQLRASDRVLWVVLSRLWAERRKGLLAHDLPLLLPVLGNQGMVDFPLAQNWARAASLAAIEFLVGTTPKEIRELIRNMSKANVFWGAPRLHGELLKLGIEVSQATIAKYMVKRCKPPSQTWRTFLENHVRQLVSVDFFVVPTVTFRILYVFIVLAHERRRVLHFNVTDHPTAEWTAAQLMQAFPWDSAPRYLLQDRNRIYGDVFRMQATNMAISEVLTAPRSPWQSPYVERLIGSIRRECLDHLVVMNESSLRRQIASYLDYYHGSRCHLTLGKDSPDARAIEPPELGRIIAVPKVGGLHHRYERRAA